MEQGGEQNCYSGILRESNSPDSCLQSEAEHNRVLKVDSGLFYVASEYGVLKCRARSKLKKDAIIVGDFVTLCSDTDEYVIEGIKERRNRLIRPSIANVDQIILMVAALPEIDYLLIDKLIINAMRQGIDVVICLNKSDISLDSLAAIERDYGKTVKKIVYASAISGEISAIIPLLEGKLSCFAGQSAVGKSTIINALLGGDVQKTNILSRKINRGKNTTTSSEIFKAFLGYVVDTPGFSVVDIFDILPEQICYYYLEFEPFRAECKFSTCTHTSEPSCRVREAVNAGEISAGRYERYTRIYKENKEFYDRNPSLRPK